MSEKLKVAEPETAYAAAAGGSDRVLSLALEVSRDAYPDQPEAVLVGAVGAIVRRVAQDIAERGEAATVREILSTLLPSINKIAEQVVAATKEVRIPEV